MNFNDVNALDAAAQFGLGGLDAKLHCMILSERENHVLSNIASFCGIVTASTYTKSGRQGGLPKPLSALRMMTTNDEGRSFFGLNGVLTKSFASIRAAGMELRALVGRQTAAIRRLLALLADRGGAAAQIAIALCAGAGRAGDRGGDYRAGRAAAAPGAAAAPAFERRRRG